MKTINYFLLFVLAITIISCGGDDDSPEMPAEDPMGQTDDDPVDMEEPDEPTPEEILEEERSETITVLTSDNEKVWRIQSATLVNGNGNFDISENFNVQDDEFIFKNSVEAISKSNGLNSGTIVYNPGFAIETDVNSSEESRSEFYQSPQTSTFEFLNESGTEISAFDGNLQITITEGNPSATWTLEDNSVLQLGLSPKTAADYQQVPTTSLNFTQAFTFQSNNGIASNAPGMTGSLTDNSFYIATREFDDNLQANPERVMRFNLTTGGFNQYLNPEFDFVSKQLHIIGSRLYVVGGQRINSYDLALSSAPTASVDYATAFGVEFLGLSRFGTAVSGNNIYIVGGDIDNVYTDKILVYNINTETITEFATLPEARSGARAEIVNDKLYIFGGTTAFFTPPAKDTIYIYDLNTGELTTERLSRPVNFTFTGKIENLIYVSGRITTQDDPNTEASEFDRDPFFGVYNTLTGEFTELQTNLTSPGLETVHSMAVFEGKLYIIYGDEPLAEPGQLQTWSVLVADI